MLQSAAFIAATLALAYVSRASLRAPRSHGFYRFFAWEAIVALVLLNWPTWFLNPFSPLQLISWLLLLVSIFLVVHSLTLLQRAGKPGERTSDVPLYGLEKTTRLVTLGAYRYIRHPLYSSLLFLAWGAYFKDPSWPGAGLVLLATACLTVTARVEEAEDLAYFGPAYAEYRRKTRMFIPYVF